MIIGMCGCSPNKETIENQALTYLTEKYNENFKVIDSSPSGIDVPYDEIVLYSAKYPEDKVIVYREKRGGEYSFSDNYFGIMKKDEYAQKLESDVFKIFSDCKVYFDFMADFFDNSYVVSTDFNEVMKTNKSALDSNIRVFISTENITGYNYEEKCEELLDLLKQENYYAAVQICCVEPDLYITINELNYVDIISENYNDIKITECVVK